MKINNKKTGRDALLMQEHFQHQAGNVFHYIVRLQVASAWKRIISSFPFIFYSRPYSMLVVRFDTQKNKVEEDMKGGGGISFIFRSSLCIIFFSLLREPAALRFVYYG